MTSSSIAVSIGLLVAAFAACSTPLTPRERYWELEADSKRVFIAYYPLLTPEQREELLLDGASEATARAWAIANSRPSGGKAIDVPRLMLYPESYTLTGIGISGTPKDEEITKGTAIDLRATIEYKDGRSANGTEDVVFNVEPASLGRIEEKTLRFACVASDLVVGADFFHERQGSRVFHVRKAIRSLDLSVAGSSKAIDRSEFVALKLVARCVDGTESQVDCQAQWRSLSPSVEVNGCGNLTVLSKKAIDEDPITIEASYGGATIRRAIQLSQFKK